MLNIARRVAIARAGNMVRETKMTDYLVKTATNKSFGKVTMPPTKRARLEAQDGHVGVAGKNIGQCGLEEPPSKVGLPVNDRANANKLAAKLRLTSKRLPAVHANMGVSWFEALEPEFSKAYFQKLSEFLVEERKQHIVYPPEENVYSWTRMCDIRDVKVVILGQDPYHGPNQAHGLSFSVQKGVPPPASLKNMFLELQSDIQGFQTPSHGNLSGWAKQGVLLLNACLTVRAHAANSHKDKGWEQFTDAVIGWLSHNMDGLVFLLWGKDAQKKQLIINQTRHRILQCAHPSPLSAHRGFLGCRHFSKANHLLLDQGKEPVNWASLPMDDEQ